MDDKREIIAQTMNNMSRIYKDVSMILQLTEDKMKNHGFKPQGDVASTWEVSTALNYPEGWLYRWFARAYSKDSSRDKIVGLALHLGCYDREWVEKLEKLSVSFPFAQISLMHFEQEVKNIYRPNLYNDLRGVGWEDLISEGRPAKQITIKSSKTESGPLATVTTYFVDLLALTTAEQIEKLVTEPMVKMFNGEEQWVTSQQLPVIQLTA